MGEHTAIAWTDHTWSPWWGCTKVSAGCEHCYADALDRRTGGAHWGPGKPRRAMSNAHWGQPLRWHRQAMALGERRRVFPSMCDPFDAEASAVDRQCMWNLIRETPWLDWLLVTKRPENFARMLPDDWGDGYANVWLGTSVEDRRARKRIGDLERTPAMLHFISFEPLLEDLGDLQLEDAGIGWAIIGGESGPGARPCDAAWIRSIAAQCRAASIPAFCKQLGGHPNKRDQLEDFPEDLRIREFPAALAKGER